MERSPYLARDHLVRAVEKRLRREILEFRRQLWTGHTISHRCVTDDSPTIRQRTTTEQLPNDRRKTGCPTWIRTMTRRVKVACATITPSGSEVRKGHAASRVAAVKAGNRQTRETVGRWIGGICHRKPIMDLSPSNLTPSTPSPSTASFAAVSVGDPTVGHGNCADFDSRA